MVQKKKYGNSSAFQKHRYVCAALQGYLYYLEQSVTELTSELNNVMEFELVNKDIELARQAIKNIGCTILVHSRLQILSESGLLWKADLRSPSLRMEIKERYVSKETTPNWTIFLTVMIDNQSSQYNMILLILYCYTLRI